MTPDQLTATEDRLVALWNDGQINSLCHFSGSTDGAYEAWLCRLFADAIKPGDWVLCSHRAHFHFLLYIYWNARRVDNVSDESAFATADHLLTSLVKEGRSMFLYGPRFIQSAIVAGLCGVAAGLALSIKQRCGTETVWHFGGDGCEDQGSFYEAVRFVDGRDLPCRFIIEDNGRHCGVTKEHRRVRDIAWPSCVIRHKFTSRFPHAGTEKRPSLKSQESPEWLNARPH